MSYWSSGYSSVLGPGEIRLPPHDETADADGRTDGRSFEFSGLAVESDLFAGFSSSGWSTSRRKRVFDTVVAAPALLACLPIMGAVAVLIKCSSRGPVMFRQERLGLGQKPFVIYKFRTMHNDADGAGPSVTREGDMRLTTIGRMLRKLKLDEIPQLFNVLRGDMSLVGPRPKLAHHEQMYLFCRPGITGAATLVFAHEEELLAAVPHHHVETYAVTVLNPIKARLDLEYANSATLGSDVRLLMETVFRLSRRGEHSVPESAEVAFNADGEVA